MTPVRALGSALLRPAYTPTVLVDLAGGAAAIGPPDDRPLIQWHPGLVYEYRLALHSRPPAAVLVAPHASWRGPSIYGATGCPHGLLISGLKLEQPRTFRTVLTAGGHELYLLYPAGWRLIHSCLATRSVPVSRGGGLRAGPAWLNPAGGDCRVEYVRVIK